MTIAEMKEEVIKKVYALYQKYENNIGVNGKYAPVPPEIYFNLTGSVAGKCHFSRTLGSGFVSFNRTLLKENFDYFINEIVPHEVAHYCADLYYGIIITRSGRVSHHGKEWKQMCRFFNYKAVRCHNLDISNVTIKRKTKKFLYTCDCGGEHIVSTCIHNRIMRYEKEYVCKKCNSTITFVRQVR